MNVPQAVWQGATHEHPCSRKSDWACPDNSHFIKMKSTFTQIGRWRKANINGTLSIFLSNDSMWLWNGSTKKWQHMTFQKQLFPGKLCPSRRQLFGTAWVHDLITRKKKYNSPRRKWKSLVEREERLSKPNSKFWDSHEHFSSRTMFPETQSINNDIYRSITITWGICSTLSLQYICQKKIIYGKFSLGSKFSKSFSFFFSWNSETYLLPFWPRASSQLNLRCSVSLYSSQPSISDFGTNNRVLIVKPQNVKMRSF